MITWKNPGFYKNIDANIINDEIAELEEITPQAIVDRARDEDSELHKCFEWDDTIAAENYRRQQARTILINLVVKNEREDDKEPTPVRLYVNNVRGQAYKPIRIIVDNKSEYELLLERARKELSAFTKKYETLSEFTELCEIIKDYI